MKLISKISGNIKVIVLKDNTEFVKEICKYADKYRSEQIKVKGIHVYNGSGKYSIDSSSRQILKQHSIPVSNLNVVRSRAEYTVLYKDEGTIDIFMGFSRRMNLMDDIVVEANMYILTFEDFLPLLRKNYRSMYDYLNVKTCYVNNIIPLYS